MPETITRYGWQFPAELCDLEIEFQAIRYGGWWRLNKQSPTCGNGLYWHYKRAHELLWPEDDFHRWAELILKTFLDESITVIQGGKDSSKSRSAAKFALVDFWAYPDDTLIFISSTEMRGADYRIWGDIKSLCIRALERYEWLPGKVLEAKHAICTDDLEEIGIRDPRKGVIFIPCFGSGGAWVGLQRYCGIKQKRRRLIGDECFPAGTPVDTPNGPKPIESLQVGDEVLNVIGIGTVKATMVRAAYTLIRVCCKDGREIVCTENHPFLTQKGWIKACELNEEHYILSYNEAMSILRKRVHPHTGTPTSMLGLPEQNHSLQGLWEDVQTGETQTAILHTILLSELDSSVTRPEGENVCVPCGMVEGSEQTKRGYVSENAKAQSDAQPGDSCQSGCCDSGIGLQTSVSRRERDRSDKSGDCPNQDGSKCCMELSGQNGDACGKWIPNVLQTGHSNSKSEIGNRSGWSDTQHSNSSRSGPEEGFVSAGTWVEHIEILQQAYINEPGSSIGGYRVYNLQVTGHPSYIVNGLAVHNCQFMKAEYVDVLTNLNSGDFKGIFLGNPIGQNDPLDKLGEPIGGWGSEGVIKKTTTWKNKFGGTTICLYGPDSPNFDYPQEHGVKRYPYLIGQKDIDWVKNSYGDDSHTFWMQVMGVRRAGLTARRVITRATCEQHGALDACVWSGGNTTMIAGLDAAYGGVGGDRCVLQIVEFGPGITNAPKPNSREVAIPFPGQGTQTNTLLKCYPPVIVPVSVSNSGTPEDQIATFCKNHCESMGVLPENFFFDGRGTVAIALAKIWSPLVNSIEFGGAATKRNVSQDHWTYDVESRQRRLKRCDEEYSKFVTELWFSVRYAIESGQVRELPSETMEEGCQREWKLVTRDRKEVETKADMKKRTNRSPDLFDGLVICCEGARRRGFQISKMSNTDAEQSSQKWIDELYDKSKKLSRSKELVPA